MAEVYEVIENQQQKTGYEKKVEALLEEFAVNNEREALIWVWKYKGKSQQQGLNLLETYPADTHNYLSLFQEIRSKWGAGIYRIHVKEGKKIIANEAMEILPCQELSIKQDNSALDLARELMNKKPQIDIDEQEIKFLKKMEMYKAIFQQQQPVQANPGLDLLSAVSLLKELGLNVGVGKEDAGFVKLIESTAPVLQQLAESLAKKEDQTPKQKQLEPKHYDPLILFFLSCAQNDSDPALYAHVLLDRLPQKFIETFINSANYYELVEQLHPKFSLYHDWIDEIRKEIIGIIIEQKQENEQPEDTEQESQAQEGNTEDKLPQRDEGGKVDSETYSMVG